MYAYYSTPFYVLTKFDVFLFQSGYAWIYFLTPI